MKTIKQISTQVIDTKIPLPTKVTEDGEEVFKYKTEQRLVIAALTDTGEVYIISGSERGIPSDKKWLKVQGIPDDF